MKVGFYYHIPLMKIGDQLFLPGYLAVFINSLAMEVEELFLFMHEAGNSDSAASDYPLENNNIKWINLGRKTPAWHRSIFYKTILLPHLFEFEKIDMLIVRSPSPLAPYFRKIKSLEKKITFLVVGDYNEGAKAMHVRTLRDFMVKIYTLWNHKSFIHALKNQYVIVNSQRLFDEFSHLTSNLYLIKTTTLSKNDFYLRDDSFSNSKGESINLLYTGRIVPEKGLDIIMDACYLLMQKNISVHFHIAGLIVKGKEHYINELQEKAIQLGLNAFTFHGTKQVGEELNLLYKDSHIYVLASTSNFEGFPRTIWEAMANSCPVIATKVGSIPAYLEHEKHALLIEPKSAGAIEEAILRLINDEPLRKRLIENGFELAKENTLEIQTKKLVEILENSFQNA